MRALAWSVAAATAALSAGLSVVAAHAFKGHDGTAVERHAAGARAARVRVPPAQHVPAIAGAPAPLQPPPRPPHGRAAATGSRSRDVGGIMSEPARALGGARDAARASSSPTAGRWPRRARRSRPSSPPSTSRAAASGPTRSLSRVNAAAGPARSASGALLLEAIAVALRAAALTDGIVDPTIGRALILAGYDRDFAMLADAPARLVATRVEGLAGGLGRPGARHRCGSRAACASTSAPRRRRWPPTARRAAAAAAAPGAGVLVNLGGDIAVAGPAPAGGWAVRVADDHRAPPEAPGQTLRSAPAASRPRARRFAAGAPGAHHLIDPRTGLPAVSPWRTVSVAAGSCVDANTAPPPRSCSAKTRRRGSRRAACRPASSITRAGRTRSPTGRGSSWRHDRRATARQRSGTPRAAPAR